MTQPAHEIFNHVIGGPNCSGCNPPKPRVLDLPTTFVFPHGAPVEEDLPRDKPHPGWQIHLIGKRVETYLNRHMRCVSVRHKGRVRLHSQMVILSNVKLVVQPAGTAKIRAGGPRTVHAWCKGEYRPIVALNELPPGEGREITYNPMVNDSFVWRDSGEPVYEVDYVIVRYDSPRVVAWIV